MGQFSIFFSSTKRAVAANTVAQLVGRAIGAITTLLVTIVIAHQFGAAGYGDFVKVTTYAAFFYLIVDFGINAIFLQGEEQKAWPSLVALRLLGGAFLIIASLILLIFLPGSASQGYTPAVRAGILLFSPTILLQGLITCANAIFQKHLRYDRAMWAIFFGSIATAVLLWLFVYVMHATNLLLVIGTVALGTLVTAVSSYVYATGLVGPIRIQPTIGVMKRLLIPSIPLGVTLLFNLVYFRADSVVITLSRPTSEVGMYGLAYKVFEVILVFPTFFMNAVYPFMVGGKPQMQRAQFKKIFFQSIFFLFVTSLLSLFVVWIGAPLVTFIKSDFVSSIDALRVLALSLPFFFLTSATMWALIAIKKQAVLATIYGSSMMINIIGNIVLVPSHGFMAAAWMTVVGEGVVLLLSCVPLIKYLSVIEQTRDHP